METRSRSLAAILALAAAIAVAHTPGALAAQGEGAQHLQPPAEQLFALANQARAAQGVGPLRWDPALAAAAMAHCRRMASEGEISHRYGGEADLSERAGQAGAHFSLIEENVALASYVVRIHDSWMNSPGHRANLLNASVDRVGIAVVASGGVYYAVADYARAVAVLTQAQTEAAVAALIASSGVHVRKDPSAARAACPLDHGVPRAYSDPHPLFIMRWQNPDLTQLPRELAEKLASRQYTSAVVGSCPAQNMEGSFTVFRVAVLLY